MRRIRMLGSFVLVAVLAGCSNPGTAPAASTAVEIAGFLFDPEEVRVAVGSSVTWTNADDILHTVTGGAPDAPETGTLDGTLDGPGSTYRATFPEAGTFAYFCARHTSMRGTIVVS